MSGLSRGSFLGRSALAVAALAGVRLPAADATPAALSPSADGIGLAVDPASVRARACFNRFSVVNQSDAPVRVEIRDSRDRPLVRATVAGGGRYEQTTVDWEPADRMLIDGVAVLAVPPGLKDMEGCRGYHRSMRTGPPHISAWMGWSFE